MQFFDPKIVKCASTDKENSFSENPQTLKNDKIDFHWKLMTLLPCLYTLLLSKRMTIEIWYGTIVIAIGSAIGVVFWHKMQPISLPAL